jgi:hypothetical protein
VREVVRDLDPFQGNVESLGSGNVSLYDLEIKPDSRRITRETSDFVPLFDQAGRDGAADVARDARYEDLHAPG